MKGLENEFKAAVYRVDKEQISATDEATYQTRFMEYMKHNL